LRRGRLHLSARSNHSRSCAASAKDRNVKNACVGTGKLRVGPRIIARHYQYRVDLDHIFMPPLSLSRGTEGSNPSPSSGESVANLKGPFDAWWHRETDEQGRSVVPFRLLQLAEQGWSECGAVYGVPTRDSKNFWSCGIPARGAGFLRAGKHGLVRAGRP
jgi:hypothetical protein